jgi:glycosyltransferase involved in cell wall biosynthesis
MISVLILTRNEEIDLPQCLASVAWCDDVHVFDSESTDRTREIAAAAGAHVTVRSFDGYASQRNAALTTLPFRHAWVFLLDADERPTPELAREMLAVTANPAETIGGFRMRRRDFFAGRWLAHAQLTPFYIRLVRVGRARYTREINEHLEVDGAVVNLVAPLDHYPFSKGLAYWLARHNTYSSMEAELLADASYADAQTPLKELFRTALRDPEFTHRRAAQKAIFYRMPARPLLKWFYLVLVRGAILDGRPGMEYATLAAFYEYQIELKRREILRRRAGGPL